MFKMVTYQTFLIVFAFAQSATNSSCTVVCVQTASGCQVCFKQCVTAQQTNYFFDQCFKSTHSANNQSSRIAYDINTCASQCCDDQLLQFQIPPLSSCQETAKGQSYISLIIIVVVVLVFVGICCLVSNHSTIRQKLVSCLSRNGQQHQQDKPVSIGSQLSMSNSVEFSLHKQKNSKTVYSFAYQETICSICLQNQSNASSQCGHPFHVNCLYQWIIRKQECPVCKSNKMQKVEVYCKHCYKNKIKLTLLQLPFLKVGSFDNFQCKQCTIIK